MPKAYITSRSAYKAWFTITSRSPHSNQNTGEKQGSCCCVFQAKILEGIVLERQHPRTTGDPSERRAEVSASRFWDSIVHINITYVLRNGHPKNRPPESLWAFADYSVNALPLSKIARAPWGGWWTWSSPASDTALLQLLFLL